MARIEKIYIARPGPPGANGLAIPQYVQVNLENYFVRGTYGATGSITAYAPAIAPQAVAFGAGTWAGYLVVSAYLARYDTTGGMVLLPHMDNANLPGTDTYVYQKAPLAALDYTPMFRTFLLAGIVGGTSHTFALYYRGDDTATTTFITNAALTGLFWRTA